MNLTNRIVLSIALSALIVIGGGYVLWQKSRTAGTGTQTSATSTTATSTGFNVAPSAPAYTITQVPITSRTEAPDYKSTITCASGVATSVCEQLKSQDAVIVAKLDANPTDFRAWIDLGSMREAAGDYQGAISAWGYVEKLYPANPTAYLNLADLYLNYLKDYPKAEASYLLAAKYAPTDSDIYANLFTLYTTTSYKPSATAAEDILKKGIAASPKSVNLQVLLARYYKSLGRTADAKVEYDAAIANAKAQGQTALAAEIQAEEGQ